MKILAIEKELSGIKPEQFHSLLKNEAKHVYRLQQKEIIREIYFSRDTNEAVLILECKDLEEVKKHLNTLPLVKEKLIEFKLIPLKPYTGFERLFNK